jgi:glucose/arabinose dehydrogenase
VRAVGAVVLLGVFAGLVASASGSPQRAEYRFRQVASGFDQPVYLAQPKSEPGRLYVVERPGRIISLAGGKRRTFLDIRSRVESGYSEQGLLSVAFHPGYAKNHLFYVYYTNKTGDIEIDSFRSRSGRALASSRKQLLVVNHRANDNHDGGQLEFGPDGRLYAGQLPESLAQAREAAAPERRSLAGLRVRPAESVAVLVRPGQRRSLHRRRRPERVGGDRLPVARRHWARELRLVRL